MVPVIEFRYSRIYNLYWEKLAALFRKKERGISKKRPIEFIKGIDEFWKSYERKVFREITNVSGLKWKEKKIICYIVRNCVPFSDPLTIPMYRSKKRILDILIHELIHNIFSQQGMKNKKVAQFLQEKYPNESKKTRIHIPLYIIYRRVYKKIFGKVVKKEVVKGLPEDYKRAWELSQNEEILEEVKNHFK